MEELEKDSDKDQTGGQHIIEREIVRLKSGGSSSVKIPLSNLQIVILNLRAYLRRIEKKRKNMC